MHERQDILQGFSSQELKRRASRPMPPAQGVHVHHPVLPNADGLDAPGPEKTPWGIVIPALHQPAEARSVVLLCAALTSGLLTFNTADSTALCTQDCQIALRLSSGLSYGEQTSPAAERSRA